MVEGWRQVESIGCARLFCCLCCVVGERSCLRGCASKRLVWLIIKASASSQLTDKLSSNRLTLTGARPRLSVMHS